MIIALLLSIVTPSADYHWPLDLPKELSSSFGEHRAGRLHAGIDLRTAGTGRAVHAAESGQVTRVRCSPYGYGKAVYIRFEDGNTAVYAHLESFAAPIGEYVRRAQHARRSYTVDLYPTDGELRVVRGQVIARSGQTGVGVPHLHYEIRDPQGRPINPRDLGIDWPDTTPPTLQSVLIAPLTPDSRVNGDVLPVIRPVQRTGKRGFVCEGVTARGTVGFGIQLVDPANRGANKLGVRTLTTTMDGVEQFRMTRDRLSYDTISNGLVAYHPYLYERGRFLLPWRWPGNRSEAFAYAGGDGRIRMRSQPATVRLTAGDFHGNEASVDVGVTPQDVDRALDGAGQSTGAGSFSLQCFGGFLVVSAEFSSIEHLAPSLTVEGGTGTFFRVRDTIFRAAVAPTENAERLIIHASHPRAESYATAVHVFRRGGPSRTVALDKASIEVAATSPYDTLFIRHGESDAVPTQKDLELVTRPVALWPDNAPIDTNIGLSIALPKGETRQRQLHIYRAGRNGWSRMTSSQTSDGLRTSTRSLGFFAILADEKPPAIGPAKIDGKLPRPTIEIPVWDNGSGIDQYEVLCGGDWLLTAYDPERNVLEWERDRDLPAGAEWVEVSATDAAGNSASNKYALR